MNVFIADSGTVSKPLLLKGHPGKVHSLGENFVDLTTRSE
jgi:hypothetical protein